MLRGFLLPTLAQALSLSLSPSTFRSAQSQVGKGLSCVFTLGGCCGPTKETDEDLSASSMYPPTPLVTDR